MLAQSPNNVATAAFGRRALPSRYGCKSESRRTKREYQGGGPQRWKSAESKPPTN